MGYGIAGQRQFHTHYLHGYGRQSVCGDRCRWRRATHVDRAYVEIRQRIVDGEYPPGQPLSEVTLAQTHGLDRHVASAWSNLVSGLGEMYRFAGTDAYYEAGHRFTADRDLDSTRSYLEAWRALSLLHRGRWTEAEAIARARLRSHTSGSNGESSVV